MSDSIQKVLVIGGTGLIGQPVARQLLEEGLDVTIGTRSLARARRIFGNEINIAVVDNLDRLSVMKALQDQDAVHLSLPAGPRYEDCFRNETEAVQVISSAAMKTGIKRISYLSGTAVSSDVKFPPSQAKWQAEETIRASGVPYTIWRATWFMETLTKLVRGVFIAVVGSGESRAHWLAAQDLGKKIANSFKTEEAINKVFYAFGPERLSYKEAVRIFRKIRHPQKIIIKMPIPAAIALGSLVSRNMWFGAQMLKHLDQIGEIGDPSEADNLLGRATTTLSQFATELKG